MLFNLTNENDLEKTIMVMPNRAMPWQHIMMIYLLISGVTISIAFGFFTQGLTLILPFAGLELLALGVVLYISAWRSNIKEVVNVTEEKIRIEIGRNGPEKTYELDKTWAKVVLERSWNNWYPSRLLLRSHGRQIEIGKFLNEQERQCLGAELKKVINN
ncbi:uncharacterized protein METZ01_LOCUS249583 [marine metagenome]|uniref:DUF2244 domain-containing protein n=1 Tax=marine metagenome TaxID=408172 RepID=A0A382IBV0_9ZZZZ|tara:strand:- start:18 stop:494 length:477 start_codon:yes stop_codon:yes gene_type:complete